MKVHCVVFLCQWTDFNPAIAGQTNPYWAERITLEMDLEAKSTIWNYHPLWFCNCIINVKRKGSYWDKTSFPFSDWWHDRAAHWARSPRPFIHPISVNYFLPHRESVVANTSNKITLIEQGYIYSPSETYLICLVALVTWISQRVAAALSVITEQASSSEALIWKMNTLRLSGGPCGNSHMALDTVKKQPQE